MAEVEKVLVDQHVIGIHPHPVAMRNVRGIGLVEQREIGNEAGIGGLVAHPDPRDAVALDNLVGANGRMGRDAARRMRIAHAGAAAVEDEAVIAALHLHSVGGKAPHGQGRVPMRTGIDEG